MDKHKLEQYGGMFMMALVMAGNNNPPKAIAETAFRMARSFDEALREQEEFQKEEQPTERPFSDTSN